MYSRSFLYLFKCSIYNIKCSIFTTVFAPHTVSHFPNYEPQIRKRTVTLDISVCYHLLVVKSSGHQLQPFIYIIYCCLRVCVFQFYFFSIIQVITFAANTSSSFQNYISSLA